MIQSKADEVFWQTNQRLQDLLGGPEPSVRKNLAELRRGAGKRPGEDPYIWGFLFADLPEEMYGKRGAPSREEWAIYTALTLYAVHQQGNDPYQQNMNKKGLSLGAAAAQMVAKEGGDEDARDRVSRRFYQVVLAADISAMVYYLRSFIQLLRSEGIGLDYPKLAKDLYRYQIPDSISSVRLQWGQDYYRKNNDDKEGES